MFYVLLLIFSIWLIYLHEIYGKRGRLLHLIPGPPSLPLVGNFYHVMNCSLEELFEKFLSFGKKYDPTWRMYIPFVLTIIGVNHPDDLEILLGSSKPSAKSRVYKNLVPWLGSSIMISSDAQWHARRKILTPAFHFGILKKYLDIIEKETRRSMGKLDLEGGECDLNLLPFFSNLSLNIISESAMGIDINELRAEELEAYKQAIHDIGRVVFYRARKPYIIDAMFHPMINRFAKLQKVTLKILNDFANKIIRERRKFHCHKNFQFFKVFKNTDDNNLMNDDVIKERHVKLSMLDLLLSAEYNGQIDETAIREEVHTFIWAGHETAAMGVTFLLLLLAENKDHQKKARQEVNEVLSSSNGKLFMADLKKLDYLGRCIKETLRLFPAAPLIGRYISTDLPLTHYILPAESDVFVSIFKLHRRPDFWPEPTKFDPDRFLPDQIQNRHPFAYLPFSAGPRNCIGQKFAMNELKAISAMILKNYYVEPIMKTDEIKFASNLTLKPTQPLHVKLKKINP